MQVEYYFSFEDILNKTKTTLYSLEKEVKMPIDWSANGNLLTDRREHVLIQQLST